jgi:hemolysin activation/secretion protein
MRVRVSVRLIGAVAAAITTGIAAAQTPPDAGALQRQIEQPQQPTLPSKAAPEFALPKPMKELGGATVTVQSFQFAGNSLLSEAQLAPAVASYLNRPLDFAGLQNAALAVATAYRQAGWVVRVYLPQQDVTSGTVTLQVVEAHFGKVQLDGQSHRVSGTRLRSMVEGAQAPGAPVSADALDRALLLIDDLPGVSAKGRLSAGQNPAETDLVLAVSDGARFASDVFADNAGARYTGAARIVGSARLESPFGMGDRADGVLLHSDGSDYARLSYSLPIGSQGWRVGANGSYLKYDISSDEFAALDPHGNSHSFGLETSYPLVRARLTNLYFSLAADDRSYTNYSAGTTASDYGVRAATASLYGNHFDSLGGGGMTTASLALAQGRVDLDGSPNQAADAATTDTAGSYRRITLQLARQQALTDVFSLYGSVQGQFANKNLDSSEKLYLGGPSGVRAYPVNEAGGSEGYFASFETRARLPARFDITAFFDIGSVRVNRDNDFTGAADPNRLTLKGVGLSTGWTAPFGLNVKATVARRLGSNPNPTSTGRDQDGSLVKNRIWVQASFPF